MLIDSSVKLGAIRAHEGDRVFRLPDPGTLRVGVRRLAGAFSVESVAAETPYFKGEGRGTFQSGIGFTGALNLAELQKELRDFLDFGSLAVAGRATLSGGYKAANARYRADVHAVLSDLKLSVVGPMNVERDAAGASAVIEGPADAPGNTPAAGAVVTFIGLVRDNQDGRAVLALEYEAYPAMAEKELAALGAIMTAQYGLHAIAIHHRVGKLAVGEISVVIAVVGGMS